MRLPPAILVITFAIILGAAPVCRDPETHFRSAYNAFTDENLKTCSYEIFKASSCIRSLNPEFKGKHPLDETIRRLDMLAYRTRQKLVTEEELKDAFAKAHLAIALASRSLAPAETGLQIDHIEKCLAWSEIEIPPELEKDLENASLAETTETTSPATRILDWLSNHFKFGRLEKKSWE